MGSQRWVLGLMTAAFSLLVAGQLLAETGRREPETVTALRYAGDPPVYVEGIVIRQEIPVTGAVGTSWVPAAEDGEQVAAGQRLFSAEVPEELADSARTLGLLRSAAAAAELDLPERRQRIHGQITELGTLAGADRTACAARLTALVLGETGGFARAMEDAETAMRARPLPEITAPAAGVFASACDGLETVLTIESPWETAALPAAAPQGALGRIITGDTWYLRTSLPVSVDVGERMQGVLPSCGDAAVTLTVEAVRGDQTLLSCGQSLALVAAVRHLTLELPGPTETGVEIPKKALYTKGDALGVWCLVGQAAEFKAVTPVKELEDTVVVALDQSTTAGVWPGDQLLIHEPRS